MTTRKDSTAFYDSIVAKLATVEPLSAKSLMNAALKEIGCTPETASAFEILQALQDYIEPRLRSRGTLGISLLDVGDGYMLFDEKGNLLEMSPTVRLLLHIGGKEQDSEALLRLGLRPSEFGSMRVEERQIPELNRILRFHWIRLKHTAGNCPEVLALVHDSTLEKNLLHELQDSHHKLRESERQIQKMNLEMKEHIGELAAANQELDDYSYSIAHDLRAPLRSIDGFIRILEEKYESQLSEEPRRYLQLVRKNARRMGQLIDDLLDFSRLSRQSLNKQNVHPAEIVRQALEELAGEREGRDVRISLGYLPSCQADPALLLRVVSNLVSNALKFTQRRKVAAIEIGCREEDGEPVFFVKDNGVGFDMQYSHKLFGVFQRLHRAEDYGGTGVGLAIAQRIILRHGGRMWAEGKEGEGATFFFTIPA
ncbi:MAG: ATP-binding protein [bacterium]